MSSSPTYQSSRQDSGLSINSNRTVPGLSISTVTSCSSSMYSTSPTELKSSPTNSICSSPYYYYSSPSNGALRPSYRPLDRRAHSASVRVRRRTSSPSLPPQRSASAGSSLLKESSTLHHHYARNSIIMDDSPIIGKAIVHDNVGANIDARSSPPKTMITTARVDSQRWDDSQLALELADDNDIASATTLSSSRRDIKAKVRQWIAPFGSNHQKKQQRRRSFNQWLSDVMT